MASKIEWLNGGETWNPIRAEVLEDIRDEQGRVVIPKGTIGWFCTKKSPGCAGCYAEAMNLWRGNRLKYIVGNLEKVRIFLDEEVLLKPLRWKKPRLIFPCSMTDWMEKYVPDEFRDKMLAVMALTPQHTYLTLTKCADRQREYFTSAELYKRLLRWADWIVGISDPARFPLKNHWLGVSAEDQKYADERIPLLLQTPAAVRWVSAEPLLGPIDLTTLPVADRPLARKDALSGRDYVSHFYEGGHNKLDWVVVGGESGPGARPFNIEWARQIVAQCEAADVPVFVKQLGAKPYETETHFALKDKKGGDPSEWPEDLRVREYPAVRG